MSKSQNMQKIWDTINFLLSEGYAIMDAPGQITITDKGLTYLEETDAA